MCEKIKDIKIIFGMINLDGEVFHRMQFVLFLPLLHQIIVKNFKLKVALAIEISLELTLVSRELF